MRKEEIKLTRHNLASIDLSDVKEEVLDEKKEMAKATAAEGFYNTYFEKELKLFMQKQLEFIASEATDEYKLAFSRGTFNGFKLIKDWFDEQIQLSQSKFEDKDEEEEETGIPPI